MIYCLYTEDEECIHLFFPSIIQALIKRVMAAAHSWTCLILVWIIAETTGKTPGNTPFTSRLNTTPSLL